jgi:hypothetical protein
LLLGRHRGGVDVDVDVDGCREEFEVHEVLSSNYFVPGRLWTLKLARFDT